MKASIRRLGNSQGISIPKTVLDEVGLTVDSPVEMSVAGDTIVLRKIRVDPRAGWADDAMLAAKDGDPEESDWLGADLDAASRAESTW